MEFWLYASRHPVARERLAAIDRAQADAIEAMIAAEQVQCGRSVPDETSVMAKVIVALFHGIGIVGMIDPEAVDGGFIDAAIRLVNRGLDPEG
jgi:hypothetical protein